MEILQIIVLPVLVAIVFGGMIYSFIAALDIVELRKDRLAFGERGKSSSLFDSNYFIREKNRLLAIFFSLILALTLTYFFAGLENLLVLAGLYLACFLFGLVYAKFF